MTTKPGKRRREFEHVDCDGAPHHLNAEQGPKSLRYRHPGAGWPVTVVGMDSFALVVVFLALWIVIGLVTGVWMVRRGHNALWVLIAVVLGPLFVPIALERSAGLTRGASPTWPGAG